MIMSTVAPFHERAGSSGHSSVHQAVTRLPERASSAARGAPVHAFDHVGPKARVEPGRPEMPALPSPQRPMNRDHLPAGESERKHSQLQEANAQLVLAALTAQEGQCVAEHAHRRQVEFLAVLAHELRNPLTPIRTAAALLGRIPAGELPRVRAVIERQVAHLSRLVADLLDVSRVATGKLRLDIGSVDLAGTIAQAVDTCRPAMDTRWQRLRVQMPSKALQVRGDPLRLAQVVGNLLDNASKYTPNGGEVALSAVVTADAVVLTVSDNGIGIAAEALPHVFEPFVQDAHAVGFDNTGLGVGLAVVRELVGAHGGSVVARSAGIGLGSEFVVTLPLAGPRESPASGSRP